MVTSNNIEPSFDYTEPNFDYTRTQKKGGQMIDNIVVGAAKPTGGNRAARREKHKGYGSQHATREEIRAMIRQKYNR